MLELRPNCELCDRDLPPDSREARICSYECTFCVGCVEAVLSNVCPNCGGELVARPIRPRQAWREGVGLGSDPASTTRRRSKVGPEEIAAFCASLHEVDPAQR